MRVTNVNIQSLAAGARARTALIVFSATSLILALAAASAGAQQVTDAQYANTVRLMAQSSQDPVSDPATDPGSSALPFTGLDVFALFAVGVALAAVGFVLWKRSRTETETAGLR